MTKVQHGGGAFSSASPARSWTTLRTISVVLVVIGLLISGYLSYVKLSHVEIICAEDAGFSCAEVQDSDYGELFGIPVAYLGFASYVVIGALILLEDRVQVLREYGIIFLFGIVLFGWMYSMFLVYVQGVVLGKWCEWCLMHEANFTVLFAITAWRFMGALSAPSEG